MMRARPLILTTTAALLLAAPAIAQTPERPEDYPAGPGREQTFYTCTPCHGFKLVAQQAQSRRQWDDTIDFMMMRHNMPKPAEADRKALLDYLETAFPPRTAPGGFRNPFLPQ